MQAHQFHILSNCLQASFSLFTCKNAYVESSSLLVRVAKTESSKIFSPGVHTEGFTFMEKANIWDQHWQPKEQELAKANTISRVKEKEKGEKVEFWKRTSFNSIRIH